MVQSARDVADAELLRQHLRQRLRGAFVMAGAVLVGFFAFRLAGRRGRSFLGGALHLPARRDIDARLIAGSAVFGVGWGLAGFCPGPALVALGAGIDQAALFVAAMLAGMVIYDAAERLRLRR